MTNEETTKAIQNLIDRVNRVEANAVHNKPVGTDGLEKAIDAAIDLINTAIESHSNCADISRRVVGKMLEARIINGR